MVEKIELAGSNFAAYLRLANYFQLLLEVKEEKN